MNIQDAGLSPLVVGKLAKKFNTIEELPDTMEELLKIKGLGEKTADQVLAIKEGLAKVKGSPPAPPEEPPAPEAPAAPAEPEPAVPAETPREEPAPEPEEKALAAPEEGFPTSRWSKYQLLCLLALDRRWNRYMDRAAYTYLTSLVGGSTRPEAMRAAGLKGVVKADEFAAAEVARLCENFTLVKAREFGPPAGSVS